MQKEGIPMELNDRIIIHDDNNIDDLRTRYPDGLRFVVGDTHGQAATLGALMKKIKFDPEKDHIYFVGDYNGDGNVQSLLECMAPYYRADFSCPGFHMIRGNHERELFPLYPLSNLPDIIVLKEKHMTYYIAHAGMVAPAFDLINADMERNPGDNLYAYKLDDTLVQYDAPLRQIIWSRNGLYSQKSHWRNWPSEEKLARNRACIIHGHSPYCFFVKGNYFTYGHRNLFWKKQHIFFSEDLQSFNIDANVKGRFANGEAHRGLACVCIEGLEEVAAQNQGYLPLDAVKNAPNFVFATDLTYGTPASNGGKISDITASSPKAKQITRDANGNFVIVE